MWGKEAAIPVVCPHRHGPVGDVHVVPEKLLPLKFDLENQFVAFLKPKPNCYKPKPSFVPNWSQKFEMNRTESEKKSRNGVFFAKNQTKFVKIDFHYFSNS